MTNSMLNCTQYEDDLKAYIDGELSWLRRQAVRRHLTQCASCQKEILEMTQIAEDLRSAEPTEALSPALREKLLGVEPTPPQASTLPKREGEEFVAASTSETPRPPVLGGPLRNNLLRSKEVGSRKRPKLAWGLAGVALLAWVAFIPIYVKHNIITAKHANRVIEYERASGPMAQSAMPPPAAMSSPKAASLPAPPQLTVRLSDREAGLDNSKIYVHIKDPDSQYSTNGSAPGRVQTFDSNSISANPAGDPDSLRQVHKEASIGVQVADPEAMGDKVQMMVQETGGYVAANNLSTGSDGLKSGEMIVKVPVAQFETFLAQVAKLGVVQSKNISGEDITEKTSDADQTESVQEDDLQQSEARLKALGSKAKWHDQEATRDLRIQVAQSRARLVLLKRMAALGTITIDLSQTPKAVVAPPVTNGFLDSLKSTTHDAVQSLVGSASALLALVIWLLAYAPVWIPLLLIGRYALKRYEQSQAKSKA